MIKGFKMKIFDGQAEEYERRHNELWPEMKDMIHEYGGKNYTICGSQSASDAVIKIQEKEA